MLVELCCISLFGRFTPRSDVLHVPIFIWFIFSAPSHLLLMVSDSSYYMLEYHRTAGRVRLSCAMLLFYSYYSAFATFVLF